MHNLYFCNDGLLSLMDLTTMGDSSKRDNENTIGKFDSGLKYAIAILLLNNIIMKIETGGNIYEFDTDVQRDSETGKTKEMILVRHRNNSINGTVIHRTAFALQLGYEWELWMAIRELYSNCLDEKGVASVGSYSAAQTVITLEGCEELQAIIDEWDSYFIKELEPIFIQSNVGVYLNTEDGDFKVYKNGILIHRDKEQKSMYVYDHKTADIDEMRILKNIGSVTSDIEYALTNCTNQKVITELLNNADKNNFEGSLNFSYTLSEQWCIIAQALYDRDELNCNDNILYSLRNDRRLSLGVAYVPTTRTQWSENKVQVTTPTVDEPIRMTFEEEVKLICKNGGFDVEFPIVVSEIKGITCLADISKQCVYVTEEFSEIHIWEMIKAVFKIRHKNDADAIFKEYALRIRR